MWYIRNMRKDVLVNNEIYHICTKSIAGFEILNNERDYRRMQQLIKYFTIDYPVKFSDFLTSKPATTFGFHTTFNTISKDQQKLVQIIAYCLMPTHIHLILKQLTKNGISIFMKDVLNSYTRFFNITHKRKGPLWEGRFRSILVKSDEQLLHLTRYLHLNAVTARLVDEPEDWAFSSYQEYLNNMNDIESICQFDGIMEIKPVWYNKFVKDEISYQRELAKIKRLLLE